MATGETERIQGSQTQAEQGTSAYFSRWGAGGVLADRSTLATDAIIWTSPCKAK